MPIELHINLNVIANFLSHLIAIIYACNFLICYEYAVMIRILLKYCYNLTPYTGFLETSDLFSHKYITNFRQELEQSESSN